MVAGTARRCALAALATGRWALTAATGETGRRVARAAGLTLILAVLVTALYDRAEVPTAAARQTARPSAGAGQAGPAAPGTPRREGPAQVGGLRGRARAATEVRVLVLADHGHGRLRTALVRVRRGPGGWSVR
jgi:hypothetical protein